MTEEHSYSQEGMLNPQGKMATDLEPCTRLFLSADIVDSTKIKEDHNITKLCDRYRQRRRLVESVVSRRFPASDIPPLLDQIPVQDYFPETDVWQLDWPAIIATQFSDFHGTFDDECKKQNITLRKGDLWKCLGDEMIYSFTIHDNKQAHSLCLAFLQTIRKFDEKRQLTGNYGVNNTLRMKGTAWTANFPIRNRAIKILDLKPDYLGQDIDIGFRITKFSNPMILCLSMDLAYLLGKAETSKQLVGAIVGWEPLKGVWNDTPYPIIWAAPPEYTQKNAKAEFPDWERSNCQHAKTFKSLKSIPELKGLLKELDPILQSLGAKLGLTNPYIYGGEAPPMPEEHRHVHNLLLEIAAKPSFGAEKPESLPGNTTSDAMTGLEHLEGKHG